MVATALLCAFAYFVLIGGTSRGEVGTVLRLVNGLIGGAAIGLFIVRVQQGSDRIDLATIAAVAVFSMAGVFSTFPRQSFDAVLAALALGAAFYVARRRAPKCGRPPTPGDGAHRALRGDDAHHRGQVVPPDPPVVERHRLSVVPPLNFEHAAAPWGHRHDLALLVALLYPAWWIGRQSALRRVCAVVFGALALLIVIVDASRAVWLALAVATAVVALPAVVRRWQASARLRWAVVGAVGIGVAVAVVTGVGPSIIERATNLATVDYRAAMWGPLVSDWLEHPLAGNGPGSFPWVLQRTEYFDTNSWAPRHPDSAVVMVLAEGGLLGIAALAILVAGVGPAVLRSRSVAARWALIAFGISSLLANPTDFAFLVVLAVAWAAYALPFDPPASDGDRSRARLAIPLAFSRSPGLPSRP